MDYFGLPGPETIQTIFDLDRSQISFENPELAIGAAVAFILTVIVVLVFRRRKFRLAHEGHSFGLSKKDLLFFGIKRGVNYLPVLLFIIALPIMWVAIAEPYVQEPVIADIEVIEAREVHYFVDLSGSMNARFTEINGFSLSKGQAVELVIARLAYMRRDKGDRTCLWGFSNNAYRFQDCTGDTRAFLFQVISMPHSLSSSRSYTSRLDHRVMGLSGEGGTRLKESLQQLIISVDEEEDPDVKERTLFMATDADILNRVNEELSELSDRGFTPYILFVDTRMSSKARELMADVESYGGMTFDVQAGDEEALQKAIEAIDKAEKANIKVHENISKNELAPVFMQAALFLWILSFFLFLLTSQTLGRVGQ